MTAATHRYRPLHTADALRLGRALLGLPQLRRDVAVALIVAGRLNVATRLVAIGLRALPKHILAPAPTLRVGPTAEVAPIGL